MAGAYDPIVNYLASSYETYSSYAVGDIIYYDKYHFMEITGIVPPISGEFYLPYSSGNYAVGDYVSETFNAQVEDLVSVDEVCYVYDYESYELWDETFSGYRSMTPASSFGTSYPSGKWEMVGGSYEPSVYVVSVDYSGHVLMKETELRVAENVSPLISVFSGNLDGDNHCITNYAGCGLFGTIQVSEGDVTIKNLTIEYASAVFTQSTSNDFGGLAQSVCGGVGDQRCDIINVHTRSLDDTRVSLNIRAADSLGRVNADMGGIVGCVSSGTKLKQCSSTLNMTLELSANSTGTYSDSQDFGGLVGHLTEGSSLDQCMYSGIMTASGMSSNGRMGGLVGVVFGSEKPIKNMTNCLFNGSLYDGFDQSPGLEVGYPIVNGFGAPECFSTVMVRGVVRGTQVRQVWDSSCSPGSTTLEAMKLRSTYDGWEDFDTYWVINDNIDNGLPTLRCFLPMAKVTGFDGSGSSGSPYLIKTYQDLLGMASYYNDNYNTESNLYWKLANNIDVNKDANNALIHFTPICYEKKFDGYFDGNNCTISGLLIDKQYEYTGLFGTIASGSYVKNLTVTGNIYWDQAYAVGGVAGRVMSGGYLSGCTFTGNIIGVLDTKPSTECNGVVGKYEIGGAINCSATYVDMKYAQIGGTTTAPTYTYYLYDWARITTNLYDKQVS